MPNDPIPALLEAAAGRGLELDESSARFALQFSSLMLDIALADREFLASERSAMVDALDNWTGLGLDAIDLVIDQARADRIGSRTASDVRAAAAEFSHQHGKGPALLLLDCLFGVATAEGVISADERARIQDVAAALEVDEALLMRFQQRWTPSDVRGDAVIPLAGDHMTIGRHEGSAIRLEDPDVASHHATLVRRDGGWWIEAASAESRTLVEDRQVTRERLGAADRVRIGRFVLRLVEDRGEIHVFAATTASALTVRDLSVSVPVADGRKTILDGVSFTALAGELIALIGPSGSGKTTLLTAISGVRTPDRGEVLLDGEPFHALLAGNRNLVGEVPQEDIVHPTLTVGESLWYSARLRLAQDLRASEVQAEVDRVIGELDIEAIRDSLIGDATRRGISGGQRKRVNLGQELLSRSTHMLFLDEPTSGLDPHGTQEIVNLVRDLADHDRIVFLVTHDLGSRIVRQVDQLLVLTRGGRLAFFGPPDEACAHFGVSRVDEIFAAIQDREPEEVAGEYRRSGAWRRYVTTREKVLGIGPAQKSTGPPPSPPQPGRLRQLGFLSRRYARVKLRDRGGMAILLLQAPVLAVLMAIVFPRVDPSALFIVSLATLWFGCSASVREVIAELPILRRERRAGLRLLPYLASKTVVLGVICALQCALLLGLLYPLMGMGEYGFSLPKLYLVALLTGGVGITLGLAVSCAFTSSEAAVGTLPLILIPQIVFGGLIVYVKEMPAVAGWLSQLTATRWSFNGLLKTGEELVKPGGAAYERVEVPMSAILYLLGFKETTDVLDTGMSFGALCGVLVGMALVFFVVALGTLMVRERRRGL
jgi:ABC transport system ATP-binding/permease protein